MEQIFILDDFSGGLRYGTSNKEVKDSEGVVYQNVLSMPGNYLRSRSGMKKKNSSPPSKGAWINGITEYVDVDGNSYLVVTTCQDTSNGVTTAGIYRWDESTSSFIDLTGDTITWSPDAEDLSFFEMFQGYLVIVNGVNRPVVWQSTWDEVQQFNVNFSITGVDCIPTYVKAFKQFLFFANTLEGGEHYMSRIRWCEPADITSWPSENYMDLDADDGDEIRGIEVLGDLLVVFKTRKIYVVSYAGGELVFEAKLVLDGRGCVSGASITSIYNDLIFLAEDGIYSFDGTGGIEEISAKIKPLILEINPAKRKLVQSAPMEEYDQLWFAVPHLDSERNNKVFVLNYTNPDEECWYVYDIACSTLGFYYRYADLTWGDLTDSIDSYSFSWDDRRALSAASILLTADYNGYLYEQDAGTSSDDGTVFTSRWQSKYFDYEAPYLNKRLIRIILFCNKGNADDTLKVKVYRDFNETSPSEYSISLYDSNFVDNDVLERRIDLSEQGRYFKIELCQDELPISWAVYRIIFVYHVKGRTIRT
ncbi:MAG: hypothetical protein DRG33_08115 [Deltaproteobacteria bacterium]|nr:MAG: hypothetical protein DRG33_08115 [Deltaproteobacteria bacterium]